MKIQSLCIFFVLLTFFNLVFSFDKENSKNDKYLSGLNSSISGYFYLQKLYRGDDLLKIIKFSQQEMTLKYFTLNDKVFTYSPNKEKMKNTEEGVQLQTLYDKSDDAKKGQCCKKVVYVEYPGCKGQTCPKSVKLTPDAPQEIASNYCIELNGVNESYMWRVCSDNKPSISKLYTKMNFNIISLESPKGKMDPKILEKFMLNNSEKDDKANEWLTNWHWSDQKFWKGHCGDKSILQSPINIHTKDLSNSSVNGNTAKYKFGIDYEFGEVRTLIKNHFHEMRVHFLNSAGVLKFWVDNNSLVFQPEFLSFRFPGEHLIDSKRFLGEVLIHFSELNPNRKTWITSGLVLSIPLNPTKDNPNLKFFDDLNPDFWKIKVKKDGKYEPTKTFKKTPLIFSLKEMVSKSISQNTKFFTYIGSHTTPPCESNAIYIVSNKPIEISNCQFKILRENSIVTDRPQEIHSRLAQDLKGRKVYEISKMKFSPQIKSIIPMMQKKYKAYSKIIPKQARKIPTAAHTIIKKPLRPKTLKALNKHVAKLNKKAKQAMKKKGPEAAKARKEAIQALKAETDTMSCDKI